MSLIGSYDDGKDTYGDWGSDSMKMEIFIPYDINIELTQNILRPASIGCNIKRKIIGTLICNRYPLYHCFQ
jgi:hypothetical protein